MMHPLADYFASNDAYTGSPPGSATDDVEDTVEGASKMDGPNSAQDVGQRVCDRCIVKKVKCDMKLPTCSRCLESDTHCVYSVKKRKPGPVKGSKHAKRRIANGVPHQSTVSETSSPDSHRSSTNPTSQTNHYALDQTISQGQPLSASGITPNNQVFSLFGQSTSPSRTSNGIPTPLGISPSQDHQRLLLEKFFIHIHPSIPLFHQQRLLTRYDSGTLSEHLLLTICVVTAKVLGMESVWNASSLEDCTTYLLDLNVIDKESAGKVLSLDNFRQACLLAFYTFHQYPGDKAWMRIGNLTRKAYQCGLHRIDAPTAGSLFEPSKFNSEDMEEWRYVWWCIYCLDSYSNVTAVTPFIVEIETVKTALVTSSLTGSTHRSPVPTTLTLLPDDTDLLWKTVKAVTTSAGEINFNMHILTTTLIREAATILRLRRQSTSKKLRARIEELENNFSAFRLALPSHYLNASRNAFTAESSPEHHARLICVMHIHLSRIMTYCPSNPQSNEAEWRIHWQQMLESAEDVVSVVKQWDSQYFSATDPAICFIISICLVILHCHCRAANTLLEFKVRLDTHKDVLLLFLEQFASAWSLPRFLIISFEQLRKIVTGPLTALETDRILSVATGPLTYRWLNFLALSSDFENLDSPGRIYENLFTQEWDSNEWEALMPVV